MTTRAHRRQIEVEGLGHAGAPFPVAVRSGSLVLTSAIHGRDPVTRVLADSVQEQAAMMFANVRRVIEAAGGTPDDILKVVVFAADAAQARPALNAPWIELFPDPDDRPVRHTQTLPLPAGFLVQAEFTAIIEEKPK